MRSISIKQLLLLQLVGVIVICAALAWHMPSWGSSCLLGATVMGVANGYFMRTLFGKRSFDPRRILLNFYRGELGKLIILAIGTALCAKLLMPVWWPYILGVAIVQLSLWLTPFLLKEQRTA